MTREPPSGKPTPCFWCRARTRTRTRIAIDIRTDYAPCETCKAEMAKGIAVIECRDSEPFERHIRPGMAPTGRWAVVRAEGLERVLPAEVCDAVIRERQLFLPEPLFTEIATRVRS